MVSADMTPEQRDRAGLRIGSAERLSKNRQASVKTAKVPGEKENGPSQHFLTPCPSSQRPIGMEVLNYSR